MSDNYFIQKYGGQPKPVIAAPQDPSKVVVTRGNEIDNSVKGATAADVIRKAKADAIKAEAEAKKAQQDLDRGGLTPDQIAERQGKITQFNALAAQINRVQELYNQGVGRTKGPFGLMDYLPSDKNAAFDAAGAALSQQGLGAFRVPGTGTVSDRDAIMFDRANLPTAATRDAAIEEQLRGLRSRLEQEYASRGLPAPQWTPGNQSVRSVPQVSRTVAQGQTRNEFSAPLSLKVDALMNAGASKAEIDAMLAANKFPPLDGKTYNEARQWMSANPGKSYFGANINRSVDNTALERFSGSPLGSAVIGAANMGGFGGVQALAPEAYQASQDANPTAAMIGSIGGGLAGTSILGRIGAGTVGRLAPRLMQGGGRAQFGRNLAADATYGGIYGGVTEGDPLTGAGVAALGSAGGQALGSVAGRAVGGLTQTPAAQALVNRGVNSLTTGQRLGGVVKGIEDRLAGLNIIGDQVNARRLEAFRDYNAAEFADAGRPINFTPTDIADAGLQQLNDAKSAAYRRALDPARINTLNDPALAQDIVKARAAASQIPNVQPTFPQDYAQQSLKNRLQGSVDPNGILSGRDFQESYRGLARDARSRANGDYGFEIQNVARLGQDALAGALERQNPGAFAGFKAANETNRRASVLADAINRARNGGRTGEVDVFAPSQMLDAAAANKKKFPGGLDTTLAKNAQEVMPNKVPDSGTTGRLGLLALPSILGGGGVALDQVGLTDDASQRGLAIGALLALGGTKGGQAALNKVLFDRPAPASAFGALVRKHKGLLGSAFVPLALEANK